MDTDIYHSYTQALRHPIIIGHVAGWRLPWALSASQLAAIAGVSGVLLVTRPVWAHLGGVGNLAFFTLAVTAAEWAVRHWRIEGRSPFLVAAGFATVILSPGCRRGVRNARPVAPPRPVRGGVATITIRPASSRLGSHDDGLPARHPGHRRPPGVGLRWIGVGLL